MFGGALALWRRLMAGVPFGVWYDVSGGWATRRAAEQAGLLRGLGFSRVNIMLNDHHHPDDATRYWSPDQLVTFADALRAEGIRHIGVSTWVRPQADWLEAWLASPQWVAMAEAGVKEIGFDTEQEWYDEPVRGWASKRAAAHAIASMTRTRAAASGLRGTSLEMTTFPGDGASQRDWAGAVDAFAIQGYSKREWHSTPRFRPGPMQHRIAQRTAERGMPLIMGLAAYQQDGVPGYTAEQYMAAALGAALTARPSVQEVRWWSWKHIAGPRPNGYAARFFDEVAPQVKRSPNTFTPRTTA